MQRQPIKDDKWYAAAGMHAIVPGLQIAVDTLQDLLTQISTQLDGLQAEASPITVREAKRIGRPPKKKGATGRSGWPDDPEERKAEMARRMAKRAKPPGKLHPRDPRHPEHEKWKAKLRRAQLKKWNSLSPADRKKRLALMQAGHQAAAVKLEATA
jgi:hypothetical protein